MPRLLKRQINQLVTYREGFYEITHAIKHEFKDGTKTDEVLPTNYQHMVNVLTAAPFFRNLGGRELLSFTVAPRTMDTIHLQVRSISPDGEQESRYIFTLKFVTADDLTKFINLR